MISMQSDMQYLVWVGGVEIELYTGEHAEIHANETAQYFKWQGYDDVAIETIQDYGRR